MRVLITGSRGFVGQNLAVRLGELGGFEVLRFDRGDSTAQLQEAVAAADAVVHLAGVNRPSDPGEFQTGNADLTATLCTAIAATGRSIPLLVASSIQAEVDNPYGRSKRAAEDAARALAATPGAVVTIYRLPNLFGKWCRPNYNSVVATFCHNLTRDLPITVNDPAVPLRLCYVDDVVTAFIATLRAPVPGLSMGRVEPEYRITLGELAAQLEAFKACRSSLVIESVGTGLVRALYSTFVSHLPPERFAYDLPKYGDARGVFVEMLKHPASGQFSYFTAHPGITRGGHYHHSKTEKFLVLKGRARFKFRHIVSGETHAVITDGEQPQVVETVPGWTHDITNIGDQEMVVMLWANEIFDRERPDTHACPV